MKLHRICTTKEDFEDMMEGWERPTLVVRVSPTLLAELLKVPYVRTDGKVVRMESVYIWANEDGSLEAEPVFHQAKVDDAFSS